MQLDAWILPVPPVRKDPHVSKNIQIVYSSQLEGLMEILSVEAFGLFTWSPD